MAVWGLTPELSRAERDGREPVLPACPEVSTKPRHGVGLNDLLGGTEARDTELRTRRPKPKPGRLSAPANLQPVVSEAADQTQQTRR